MLLFISAIMNISWLWNCLIPFATIKLRCANHLADVILEQFGKDTMLIPDGADDFTVSVPVQISKPFYAWAAGFGADMKILFPQAIVNEMRAFIQELSEMYKDDGKM